MPKHERFEELAAAASIGQANGAELAELQEHLAWCSQCQESHTQFLQMNAAQYAKCAGDRELSHDATVASIDSSLLRERFLKKAAAEGIVFSKKHDSQLAEPMFREQRQGSWPFTPSRAAAALFVVTAIGAAGYYVGVHQRGPNKIPITIISLDHQGEKNESRSAALSNLESENRDLAKEIANLKDSLTAASQKLSYLESSRSASEKDRMALLATMKEREDAITALQGRLDQAQNALIWVRAEYEKSQTSLNSTQAVMIEDDVRIQELSAQLAEKSEALVRQKDLLTAGRDIRELMAARNLHIVDVFDTDPKGKTRPAFGRIFFTEGKSLLFYAYDMPDARLQDVGYHYRIWGKKEGPNQRAKNLGIFYSDDKSQKRWVFQYDDPKVLNEIDSVFVTLEPPTRDPKQPKGDKLLYAYLKGQPNHP